jgi:hypothetical protein
MRFAGGGGGISSISARLRMSAVDGGAVELMVLLGAQCPTSVFGGWVNLFLDVLLSEASLEATCRSCQDDCCRGGGRIARAPPGSPPHLPTSPLVQWPGARLRPGGKMHSGLASDVCLSFWLPPTTRLAACGRLKAGPPWMLVTMTLCSPSHHPALSRSGMRIERTNVK